MKYSYNKILYTFRINIDNFAVAFHIMIPMYYRCTTANDTRLTNTLCIETRIKNSGKNAY